MTLAEARAIGAHYDLNVASLEALAAGSVNSNFRLVTAAGERFFLRVYEEQDHDGARAELTLLRELGALGVPTPLPLPRRSGEYDCEHAGKPVGLLPWQDGEILCLGRITPRVAERLGEALARVHACSPSLSRIPKGRFGMPSLLARLDLIDAATEAYARETRFIRDRLARLDSIVRAPLPSGLIHGDLFRDNTLWKEGELVALLDFESASEGVFVYDIMVCVHAWCYGDAFDLALVGALLAGYCRVRPLRAEEWLALPAHGALAALRFATTRITDFSLRTPAGQQPARDYRRFLGRLAALDAGALEPLINPFIQKEIE
jgi:homoserine kinase type II